jgi:hypothetical protein
MHELTLRCFARFAPLLALVAFSLPVAGSQSGAAQKQHPALDAIGARSFTAAGMPGDPLNVAFIGSERQLLRLMADAHWEPADPITLRSSMRIAIDSVARRPYVDAPVSNLFVNGKKQDFAFEQAASGNPSKRHHVRFWRVDLLDALGRPLWIGAATYDMSIGLSHVNHHVTHHIDADVDSERDKLLDDARGTGHASTDWIDDFQSSRDGHNGGGDPFHTDGRLGVIVAADAPASHPP